MLRRTSSLLVAIALALPLGSGCTKKPKLTEVEVPEAGVSLRYDVTPGQEYGGHVKMRNSAQTPVGDVVTTIEFDVALAVTGTTVGDAMLVRATVREIALDMRLPEGIPAAAAGGMNPEAAKALNGMELRFNLDARGEVDDVPEPPESAPPETKVMIGLITTALTTGLSVRVPEQPVKDGESWDAKSSEQREGVRSSSSTGRLDGLGRNEAGEDIAKLVYTGEMDAERSMGEQKFQVKQKIDTEVSFSATGGYPASIKRKINTEIVGQGSTLSEIEASWTKGGKQQVESVGPAPTSEVQDIDDPCDPDYVGMGECVEAGAAEEPAEAPAAEDSAPAAAE
ncbi:MAG: hypothetical protein KDK70_09735 [Myxococcales bacterium]|nr:hypothetical protein [Myxococcales bacterium]